MLHLLLGVLSILRGPYSYVDGRLALEEKIIVDVLEIRSGKDLRGSVFKDWTYCPFAIDAVLVKGLNALVHMA